MDKSVFQCINVLGLALNAIGACLLIAFTSPGLSVTDKGEELVGWTNSPPPEQRAINLRKYRMHKCGFKMGIVLLAIGYIFQLLAAII
jgi:hypothetical protein